MNTATESLTDTALNNARVNFNLAEMLEAQAATSRVGDELTGRVGTLQRRAAQQRELAEGQARAAFALMMQAQFAR